MKSLTLSLMKPGSGRSFQMHRLGLHEAMSSCLVNRPEGTGDYLIMLFHSEATIRGYRSEGIWPASTLIVWTPKDGHFYGNPSGPWNHSWFHFSGRDVPAILKKSRIPIGQPIAATDASLMERYLLENVAELNGWPEADETIQRNLFENFIRSLARQVFAKTERLAPIRLLEVKFYLEEHFAEQLRLPDLARRAGWSVPHFCTEFRRFFGVPVIQYVQQLRMNQAAYLLRDHNRRIREIAVEVGYPDLYAFSKMFKRAMGISPRLFRNRKTDSSQGSKIR